MPRNFSFLFAVIFFFLIYSCEKNSPTTLEPGSPTAAEFEEADPYILKDFEIKELSQEQYPLTEIYLYPLDYDSLDENGVVLFQNNGRFYYLDF